MDHARPLKKSDGLKWPPDMLDLVTLGDPLQFVLSNFPSAAFRRIALGFSLALAVATSSNALASPGDGKDAKDDAQLKRALHQDLAGYLSSRSAIEHISTLSLTVTFRGSKEQIKEVVGTTEYDGGKPVTTDNLFQIGSNTKAFTAVILLKLEAQSVLSMDDDLGKWLPQYPAWSKVTIRQLLNMTSGIPTYDGTKGWNHDYNNNPLRKFTPEELVAYVYPTIETKDVKWAYSNTGYILAQMVIDKASRSHSYRAEVNSLISDNHLRNTFYESDFYPTVVNRRLVSGYYVNTDDKDMPKLLNTDTKNYSLGWAQGAGGIISDPTDLAIWVRALFEGDVLPAHQKAELESLVSVPDGIPIPQTSEKHPFAFGLGVGQLNKSPIGLHWFYQGSTIGYRAVFAYMPDSGLIISVFTNSQTAANLSEVDKKLLAILYETLKKYGKS
jgi:D-alanyl-D-alanine carboxypeptidase